MNLYSIAYIAILVTIWSSPAYSNLSGKWKEQKTGIIRLVLPEGAVIKKNPPSSVASPDKFVECQITIAESGKPVIIFLHCLRKGSEVLQGSSPKEMAEELISKTKKQSGYIYSLNIYQPDTKLHISILKQATKTRTIWEVVAYRTDVLVTIGWRRNVSQDQLTYDVLRILNSFRLINSKPK